MKNTKSIIILIMMLTIILIILIPTISKASIWSDIFTQGGSFTDNGTLLIDEEDANDALSDLFNVLFYLGMAIAIIVGGVLGITYMLASAESKAKIKESMMPYVIGCIVVFGAFSIWKITVIMLNGL